jgi:hypothetical protein
VGKIEHGLIVIRLDGEDFLEDALETHDCPFGGGHLFLQELLVGIKLDLDQIRRVDNFLELSEVETFRHGFDGGGLLKGAGRRRLVEGWRKRTLPENAKSMGLRPRFFREDGTPYWLILGVEAGLGVIQKTANWLKNGCRLFSKADTGSERVFSRSGFEAFPKPETGKKRIT